MRATPIARLDYTRGRKTAAAVSVPLGDEYFVLKAIPDAWPALDSDVLRVHADISYDGGATWALLCEFHAAGTPPDPSLDPTPAVGLSIREPLNPNRQVRVWIDVLEPLRTQIDVETGLKIGPLVVR